MRVIRRVYNTFAFQSCDIEVPAVGTGSTSIYIDITVASRAVLNIARACACNILYLHEGASPRRRYFRIARRAQRARVLYDGSALEARNDIVYIHERALLKCSCNATN